MNQKCKLHNIPQALPTSRPLCQCGPTVAISATPVQFIQLLLFPNQSTTHTSEAPLKQCTCVRYVEASTYNYSVMSIDYYNLCIVMIGSRALHSKIPK